MSRDSLLLKLTQLLPIRKLGATLKRTLDCVTTSVDMSVSIYQCKTILSIYIDEFDIFIEAV